MSTGIPDGELAFIFLSSILLSFLDRRKRDTIPSDIDPVQTVERCVAEQPAGMILGRSVLTERLMTEICNGKKVQPQASHFATGRSPP
jgi:hypothetical protein